MVPRGSTKHLGTSGRGHSTRRRARYFPRQLPSGVPNIFAGPLCIDRYAASRYDPERCSYSRSYLTNCAVLGTAILSVYHTGHPAPVGDTRQTAPGAIHRDTAHIHTRHTAPDGDTVRYCARPTGHCSDRYAASEPTPGGNLAFVYPSHLAPGGDKQDTALEHTEHTTADGDTARVHPGNPAPGGDIGRTAPGGDIH